MFNVIMFEWFSVVVVVPTGGLLLERFAEISLPARPRRDWIKLRKTVQRSKRKVTSEEFAKWLEGKLPVRFYFHVLVILSHRGASVNKQLFYIGLLFKHKGLSRSGLDMVSSMGLSVGNRSFDDEEAQELERCRKTTRCVDTILCLHLFSIVML